MTRLLDPADSSPLHRREAVAAASSTLTVRLLGSLEVESEQGVLPLPQSKKTRALLAYLVLTGRAQRRERLCALFWDVADDPRGALRWSLSKLRQLVDDATTTRLCAGRDSVAFEPRGARVDALLVREALAPGVGALSLRELEELAGLHRGELLEGLDLPDFHEYRAWCAAEREHSRRQRSKLLGALVERLRGEPEAALGYARELAQVDALDEAAHASVLRLLMASGRGQEAREYYESARRLLSELGTTLAGHLDSARREGLTPPQRPLVEGPDAVEGGVLEVPVASAVSVPLAGRRAELEALCAALDEVNAASRARALLVTGEPGIGKSRLVAELCSAARARGATVLEGRAHETDSTHPYAPWLTALSQLPLVARGDGADLSAGSASREQLFGAVVDRVASCTRAAPPVVLVLEDVQWCDEASLSLFHHVLHANRCRPLLGVLTARSGELADNPAALKVLRALRREGQLAETALGPLNHAAIAELVSHVAPGLNPEQVIAHSAGNPLFARELGRAWARHPTNELPRTLTELVRDRVESLASEVADVLRWSAVLGKSFGVQRLAALMSLDAEALARALAVLERHDLLQARSDGGYAFTHDLIRSVVYSELSDPRRRLMHLRVARALEPAAEQDGAVAADLADHAGLAGEPALAARACVRAGRRCLRLFATREALALARRGRSHADGLPADARIPLVLELLQITYAAQRPAEPSRAAEELEGLAERALEHGRLEHARLAFHLLSYLRWEGGAWSDAERYALEAERVSRSTDEPERMLALAEAGRCLALLERDLPQAEALLLEARALSRQLGREPGALADAAGLLRLHEGEWVEAEALFQRARGLARAEGDRHSEFQALEHLVMLELARQRYDAVNALAAELEHIASKLREGSEMPFARTLGALSAYALSGTPAVVLLDEATSTLRAADAKHRLVYTLTRAAYIDLRHHQPRLGWARAQEASAIARLLGRPSELALALGVIAATPAPVGNPELRASALAELAQLERRRLSAEARAALAALGW